MIWYTKFIQLLIFQKINIIKLEKLRKWYSCTYIHYWRTKKMNTTHYWDLTGSMLIAPFMLVSKCTLLLGQTHSALIGILDGGFDDFCYQRRIIAIHFARAGSKAEKVTTLKDLNCSTARLLLNLLYMGPTQVVAN